MASSHGLSSDDHDDAGVDADPTAGWQGVHCGGLRLTRVRGQIYTPSVVVRGAIPEVSNLLSISRIRSTI